MGIYYKIKNALGKYVSKFDDIAEKAIDYGKGIFNIGGPYHEKYVLETPYDINTPEFTETLMESLLEKIIGPGKKNIPADFSVKTKNPRKNRLIDIIKSFI
jgi:hypothetical protein